MVANWKGGRILLLRISEFTTTPVICRQSANSSRNKAVLAAGAIYVRTESATTEAIQDHGAMLDLLNRALRKRSDQLLADVAVIMRGAPTTPVPTANTWELEQEVSAAPVEPADQFKGLGMVQYTSILSPGARLAPSRISSFATSSERLR